MMALETNEAPPSVALEILAAYFPEGFSGNSSDWARNSPEPE